MYDNIGGKIKGLAKGTFIVETIAAIIGGIIIWADWDELWGPLVLFCGPIVAWISSWLLYGFGELICETSEAKEELMEINRNIYIMAEPMIAKKEEADRQARKAAVEKAKREKEEREKHEDEERAKRDILTKEFSYACPDCNNILSYGRNKCPKCGCIINWSEID